MRICLMAHLVARVAFCQGAKGSRMVLFAFSTKHVKAFSDMIKVLPSFFWPLEGLRACSPIALFALRRLQLALMFSQIGYFFSAKIAFLCSGFVGPI